MASTTDTVAPTSTTATTITTKTTPPSPSTTATTNVTSAPTPSSSSSPSPSPSPSNPTGLYIVPNAPDSLPTTGPASPFSAPPAAVTPSGPVSLLLSSAPAVLTPLQPTFLQPTTTSSLDNAPTTIPSTYYTPPQRAGIATASLLSSLGLLFTLWSVVGIYRRRRKLVEGLERGPGVGGDGKGGKRRSRSKNDSRNDSRNDSKARPALDRRRDETSPSHHDHHQHQHWSWSWANKIRAPSPFSSPPSKPAFRGIAGLEDLKPGPAVLRSLYESGVGV